MTNLNVDLGENVLHLLEEFSKTIGTTADKVFPWFVTKQLVDGYVSLILPLVIVLVCFIIVKINIKKTDWDTVNIHNILVVVGIAVSAITFICFVSTISDSISSILAPQYGATKDLIYTLSRLVN